jgi:hypothetical protein
MLFFEKQSPTLKIDTMYIYTYIHTHTYIKKCMYIHVHILIHMNIRVNSYTGEFTCICINMYIYSTNHHIKTFKQLCS